MKSFIRTFYPLAIGLILSLPAAWSQEPIDAVHTEAAIQEGKFHGWPANNGAWIWENEILVGYAQGDHEVAPGHNYKGEMSVMLSRSKDGGRTWEMCDPENFVGDVSEAVPLREPVNFRNKGFAMRVEALGYHGADDPCASFFFSYDRGNSWSGPHPFGDISGLTGMEGRELTPRTDYLVLGKNECAAFLSEREPGTFNDKVFMVRTRDGGLSWEFVSWLVPRTDPYRGVMPQTVKVSGNEWVTAIRRRIPTGDHDCWIDAYASTDRGQTWEFRSRIGETGKSNGSPPALVRLRDGRLCCIYGNRSLHQIRGRYSQDNGLTWGEEFIVRDGFYAAPGDDFSDLGYPRLVQNKDGELVAMYYWASEKHKEQYIAATIWTP